MNKRYLFIIVFLSLVLAGNAQKNHTYEVGKQLDIFNRMYSTLDEYYVDTLKAEDLIPDAINYMLDGLDPYTEYLPASDARNLEAMTKGKYAGIGAMISYQKSSDRCIISEPYEGNPAAIAGLRSGDVIMSIDGKDVGKKGKQEAGEYTQSISNQLRGDAGTSLALEVKRLGTDKPVLFNIKRASVAVPAVPYYAMVTDSTGYIALTTFSRGCADMVLKAVQDLKAKGARSLILDLRNNGGGLAIEAVDLVNLFVPKGELILSMKGKYKTSSAQYFSRNKPEDTELPLVVLVNGQSASASEITCGALQDLDRAVVLGSRTYGKGLVQQPHELPYGGVLKLTTSHYYIPSGRCIQALDYSRRSDTGEAYRTPDSLTHVFHTAKGRKVRDGGGVTPDIKSETDTLPNLIYYLRASDQFGMFCTAYRNSHTSIAPAKDFSINGEDWQAFKDSLTHSDFTYDRQSYKALQELKKIAKSEGYADRTAAEFSALEKKLNHNLGDDLDKFKPQIVKDLNAEICLRYYYNKGAYANRQKNDKVLYDAIRLLRNPDEYKKILK